GRGAMSIPTYRGYINGDRSISSGWSRHLNHGIFGILFQMRVHLMGDIIIRLSHFLVNHERLKEEEARRYFEQLINVVDYCHSRGVYHRDLK
ncbi:hypothetical protein KI387_025025, partial [Taxus chinensis]